MWYFAWVLGLGFAVAMGILNALWGEFEQDRKQKARDKDQSSSDI